MDQIPLITLTTDFGLSDSYVGIMKGVILGICPVARLVDLSHSVPPQDILAGALILRQAAPYFPPGTIHLAVVDPGVGSSRRPVAVRIGDATYVLPDNGLITGVLPADITGMYNPSSTVRQASLSVIAVHLNRPAFWLSSVRGEVLPSPLRRGAGGEVLPSQPNPPAPFPSGRGSDLLPSPCGRPVESTEGRGAGGEVLSPTFHGRDLFAPVAAHLAAGARLTDVGEPIDPAGLVRLPRPVVTHTPVDNGWMLTGEVIYVDHFGNLITNISSVDLAGPAEVWIADRPAGPLRRTYADGRPGEMIAYIGSSGLLEIAIVNGNAAQTLNMGRGTPVNVMCRPWTDH